MTEFVGSATLNLVTFGSGSAISLVKEQKENYNPSRSAMLWLLLPSREPSMRTDQKMMAFGRPAGPVETRHGGNVDRTFTESELHVPSADGTQTESELHA